MDRSFPLLISFFCSGLVLYFICKWFLFFIRDVERLNEEGRTENIKIYADAGPIPPIRDESMELAAERREAALLMIARLWKVSLRRAELTLGRLEKEKKVNVMSPQYKEGEEGTRMWMRDVLRAGVKERMRK